MNLKNAGLTQYLGIARRNLWVLLVPATIGFLIAGVWAIIVPDVYKGQVVVTQRLAGAADKYIDRSAKNAARDLMRQVKARMLRFDLLARVVEQHGLYPRIVKEKGMPDAVKEFKQNVTFTSNGRSGTITVSFQTSRGKHPARTASEVANLLVHTFVEEQTDRIDSEGAHLSIHLVKAEQDAAEDVKRFEKELHLFRSLNDRSLPGDIADNRDEIQDAQDNIQINVRSAERNQTLHEKLLLDRQSQEDFILNMEENLTGDEDIEALDKLILRKKTDLIEAENTYTKESDRSRVIRDRIKELNRERDATIKTNRASYLAENPMFKMYRMQLKILGREIDGVSGELEESKTRVAKLSSRIIAAEARIKRGKEIAVTLTNLAYKLKDAEERRTRAQRRKAEAEFEAGLRENTSTSPLSVVQEAIEMPKPIGPRRMNISLVGLVLGLALGVGVALLRERGDSGFRTKDDLKLLLPGAVIITIPNVEPTSARALRILSRTVGACVLFSSAAVMLGLLGIRMGWWGDIELIKPFLDWTTNALRL